MALTEWELFTAATGRIFHGFFLGVSNLDPNRAFAAKKISEVGNPFPSSLIDNVSCQPFLPISHTDKVSSYR